MQNSKLVFEDSWKIIENDYDLPTEGQNASLLTTGNGYVGVRGSLEEFGSLGIQGCYIRGLMDTIVDVRIPHSDNLYLKKYYFNEERLKDFETQESIINFVDILLIRFEVDGETFYPWEGNLISWKRTLDMKTGCLRRDVIWENTMGDRTEFHFERFSSFADDHLYCMKVSVTPVNHSKTIKMISGLDLRTKTVGQKIQIPVSSFVKGNKLFHETLSGKTYGFKYSIGVCNNVFSEGAADLDMGVIDDGALLANTITINAKESCTFTIEKKIYMITSRDTEDDIIKITHEKIEALDKISYQELLEQSCLIYQKLFQKIDIQVEGDDNADRSIRFSNYHTLISIARNDAVHGLSAKALTGEIYNNFVWWDADIYQTPIFMQTMPDVVKQFILYRYRLLEQARENAKLEGLKGARYPFTSGVTGKETVWSYVRHPFMQIHISSDVPMNILNYYTCTGDQEFLIEYGMEILLETSRYWLSRVHYNAALDRYEILTVTGTDEHHPYVDNNAYTNYCVYIVLSQTAALFKNLKEECMKIAEKIGLRDEEILEMEKVFEKLYLPINKTTGMIPQFDDYFSLSRDLEIKGGSTAKSFQMKQSGLYNESQVIKQPDVMLLFAYMNLDFGTAAYSRNWDYYEARCEASSSLSYSVHAICAADMDQPERAYQYIMKTARLDIDDEHGNAHEGVHAACAAGSWLTIARGLAGMRMSLEGVSFDPHFIPWWNKISYQAVWHGITFYVSLDNQRLEIKVDKNTSKELPVIVQGVVCRLVAGEERQFLVGPKVEINLQMEKNK